VREVSLAEESDGFTALRDIGEKRTHVVMLVDRDQQALGL
jgi:hypothetical protein